MSSHENSFSYGKQSLMSGRCFYTAFFLFPPVRKEYPWHVIGSSTRMQTPIVWHIGCSGFSYKEWKGTFYPKGVPQRKWFDYYTTRFNTLELNVSFYRFPQLTTLEGWYQKSPNGFSFSMKAPRLITHYKKFVDTRSLLDDFYGTAREGLKEKLGPVLFQFPGQFKYDEEKLHQIVEQLDNSFTNVLEFRDAGWWRQDVYQLLAKHKIVFCGMSHPSLPDEAVINTSTVYYRFHGTPRLYYSEYDTAFLDQIKQTIQASPNVQTAWLYFNNTAALAAIHNADYLRDQLKVLPLES